MSTLENNRSIEDQIDELKALIEIEQAEGSIVAEMGYRSRLEMLQEELMSREKYNPAEKFGGPAFEGSAELSKMIQNGTLEVDRGEIQLPEGIEDLSPPVDVKVYQDLIENMSDDLEEPYQYVDAYKSEYVVEGRGELKIYASGTGRNRNFKQAVSWILHSEEPDTVKEVFDLDDQQMADATSVAEFLTMIMPLVDVEHAFDMLDEVHKWSKK